MTRRTRKLALGVLAAALVGGGAWRWQRTSRSRLIEPHVRQVPDLQGRSEDLRRLITEARRRALGGSVDGLGQLSRLYHANGFLNEAMRCYGVLEQLQPGEPRWPHRHATILAGFGETEPALAKWRRVLEVSPDYLPARVRLGDLLLKSNRLEEAAAAYGEVLRRKPSEPHAALGLARLDVEAGRWRQARERLEALVTATNHALGYDLIVTVYEQLGWREQAAAARARTKASGAYRDPDDPWMNELLAMCFDPYQLALAAGAVHRGGDPAQAIRLLRRSVALAPDEVTFRFQLAGILGETGDRQAARAEFEHCTRTRPDFADAWAQLAGLLEASGEQAGAEQTVAAGLRHVPGSPGLQLMRARYERKAGRVGNAVAAYRRAIELRPNEAEAYVELATLLLQADAASEALRRLQQALEVEPEHPMALSLLALSAISAGDEAGARRWLERVKAQPRITPSQAQPLYDAFRGQFGRELR